MTQRYHLATVSDAADPNKQGRLRVVCPTLYDSEKPMPGWVLARVVGASPSGVSLFWIPPVGSVVYLEEDVAGELRWMGSELGDRQGLPALLSGDYPNRVGFTTPGGEHGLVMSSKLGLLVQLQNSKAVLELTPDPAFRATLSAVKLLELADGGIDLIHSSGVQAKATSVSPTLPLIRSSINTQLAAALTEAAAACTALGLPAVNLLALAAALGTGTHNSTTLESD